LEKKIPKKESGKISGRESPTATGAAHGQSTALNPTGYAAPVPLKPLAPRPASLDGKTVWLVDIGFSQGDRLMLQVERWFNQNMPNVKTIFRRKSGVYTFDDVELWEEIKATGDCCIIGLGGCSTCCPAVVGHAATLESKYKIPTVNLVNGFLGVLADLKAYEEGMRLRKLCMNMPAGKLDETLWEYVNGNDTCTGEPVMPKIIEGLTKPPTAEETAEGTITPPRPETLTGTEEELKALFEENWWTDFRPIILPTEERVAEMLKGTNHKRDEVVGKMRVTSTRPFYEYTVENIAVNAVMAGATLEYLPVILALMATEVSPRSSSTSSMGALAVFNGPVIDELKMNYKICATQPNFDKANSLISRAWGFAGGNATGGSRPGVTTFGSVVNPIVQTPPCVAENEAVLPAGWEPLHVQKGFKREESVVSAFRGAWAWNADMVFSIEDWEWQFKRFMSFGIPNRECKLLFIPEGMEAAFVNLGFDTKEKMCEWITNNCTMPKYHYWQKQEVINYKLGPAMQGQEPYASWLAAPDDFEVPFHRKVEVVLTGLATNARFSACECSYEKSAKVDDWR